VPGGAGDAVAGPDQNDIKSAAAGIAHQLAKPLPARLHAADPVRILLDDLITALGRHLSEVMKLALRVLIDRTHSHIGRHVSPAQFRFFSQSFEVPLFIKV
jgi:hypothetical protein